MDKSEETKAETSSDFPPSKRKISRAAVKNLKRGGMIVLSLGVIAAIACLAIIPNLPKAAAATTATLTVEAEDSIIVGQGQEGRALIQFPNELSGHTASNKSYVGNLGVKGNRLVFVYQSKEEKKVSVEFRLANTTSGTTSCTLVDAIKMYAADIETYKASLVSGKTDNLRELSLKAKTLDSPCDGNYYDSWASLTYSGIPAKAGLNVFVIEAIANTGVPNIDCAKITGYDLSNHKHTLVTKTIKEATDYVGGETETSCSDCGLSEGDALTDPLGHTTDWGTCTRCGDQFYFYEAENAVITGSSHVATDSHARGGRGLDYLKPNDSVVSFPITSDKAATGVTFKLALASTQAFQSGSNWYQGDETLSQASNATNTLIVKFNGTPLKYSDLQLKGSKSSDWWSNIAFLSFTVNFVAGKNTIAVSASKGNFPNFDYAQFLNVTSTLTK